MTVVAEPAPPAPTEPRRRLAPSWMLVAGAVVVAVGIVLRFVTRSDLWLDEALSVNIARLPFSDLHEALKHDGAPPLYYVLLHLWTDGFGTSDFAVRSLSGVISVATLPLAWFAGRRLGRGGPPGPVRDDSTRTRLVAALVVIVFATSPYMIRYATEARMYALVMLLVTAGYLAFRRALERPSIGRLALVAAIVALLLYAQYWTIYLLAVVGVAVLWCAIWGRTPELRHSARRMVLALLVGGLAFAPWLGTFVYQAQHTGTPWGDPQLPFSALRQALDQFSGGTSIFHGESNIMGALIVVLLVLGGFGAATGARHVDLDVRTRPAVRWELAAALGALIVGLVFAYVSGSAFDGRYAAMMFPLLLFVVAFGFTVFQSRDVMALTLAVVAVLGLVGGIRNATDNRTQAGQVASVLAKEAKPGDTVVYCPDQLGPAVSRLLGHRAGLDQVTYPSGARPEIVDWVDYRDVIARTDPVAFADAVVEKTGDHTIWYVVTPGYRSLDVRCEALGSALAEARPGGTQRVAEHQNKFFEVDNLYEFPPA